MRVNLILKIVVQDFGSAIRMDAPNGEREFLPDVFKRLESLVFAAVPSCGQPKPLCLAIGAIQDPKEVIDQGAAAERNGIDLHVTRFDFAGHDAFA